MSVKYGIQSMHWYVNGVAGGEIKGGELVKEIMRFDDVPVYVPVNFEATFEIKSFKGFDFLISPNKKCYFAKQSMRLKHFKKMIKKYAR